MLILLATGSAQTAETLTDQRAQRRAAQRAVQAVGAKDGAPARFGLLVIPVDFSDARLPAEYDPPAVLSPLLLPETGATLRSYFRTASYENLDLDITLAPLVRLDGTRRDYSDIGYQGFTRSRQLAADALTAARAMGLDFRPLDNDGPDRLPGTADDDGEVDGVLILHAGVGQENDTEDGLVQALQFFLEEPVTGNGIQASFYAVASLHSGLGIWAHETGHLVGLEDRYDPLLHPVSGGADVRSLGGLGRFSLMASGAWGIGDGVEPALLDGYSALSVGWASPRDLPPGATFREILPSLRSGEVVRIWTGGESGPEFFILETRDPDLTPGFDTQVPTRQLLVYHVDESVPEGGWVQDGPGDYHLRVRLVEADGDNRLAEGLDDGGLNDLFPGGTNNRRFASDTFPSSWGYHGPSYVDLNDIERTGNGIGLRTSAATYPAVAFSAAFSPGPEATLDLVVTETGTPLTALSGEITATGGHVDGSWDGHPTVVFTLARDEEGHWRPTTPLAWSQETDPGYAGGTFFTYRFTGPGFDSDDLERLWVWATPDQLFDITSAGWVQTWPGTDRNTGWHVWQAPPWLTADASPVLACTGVDFVTSALWPDVTYQNRAWVERVSAPLSADITAVRLIHAVESEILHTGTAMDGARVSWSNAAGERVSPAPVDGWDQTISPNTLNALAGHGVLADSLLTLVNDQPVWRTDVFPVPAGPGPWKMELTFASNTLWRYRGWFIAHMEPIRGAAPTSAFPVHWDAGTGLDWTWPFADSPSPTFTVQAFDPASGWWNVIDVDAAEVPAARLTGLLAGGPSRRNLVRVVGTHVKGPVSSRPVVVYGDGGETPGPVLGVPRPNPATGSVRLTLDVPDGPSVRLVIYDVRGRRINTLTYPAGRYLFRWDGRDADGRAVGAGTYIIRLEGSGPTVTRKVVLLK